MAIDTFTRTTAMSKIVSLFQHLSITVKSVLILFLVLVAFSSVVLYRRSDFRTEGGGNSSSVIQAQASQIPFYYMYHISDKLDKNMGPFTDNNNHPLVNAAIINVKWAKIQPMPGDFEWTLLDKKISDFAGVMNKQVILKISPYGQDPLGEVDTDDNETTPRWVYDTVPRLTFFGGKKKEVSVPKVWDSNFYPLYEEFMKVLGERYNNDSRIAGFILGPGQNATMLAQGSKKGGLAFEASGWSVKIWELHIKSIMNIGKKHFTKPMMVITGSSFLNNYPLSAYGSITKRVIAYAARRGIWILMRGLDPDEQKFQSSYIPEMVQYLGTLNLSSGFKIGFFDDWPLLVPRQRSEKCPGPTCGRNIDGFDKELKYVVQTWDSIQRKYPILVIFQRPEAVLTNENFPLCEDNDLNECFSKSAHAIVDKWLLSGGMTSP